MTISYMKYSILIILFFTGLLSQAQPFQGKITYQITYESSLPNVSSEELTAMMGTPQEYYIKKVITRP